MSRLRTHPRTPLLSNAKLAPLTGAHCFLEATDSQDINLAPRGHGVDRALAHAIRDSKSRPQIDYRLSFKLFHCLLDGWQLFFTHRHQSPIAGPHEDSRAFFLIFRSFHLVNSLHEEYRAKNQTWGIVL
jgi:hypothetical protein